MTVFDEDTDRYLERAGTPGAGGDWDDVLDRERRHRRARRRSRVAAGGAAAVAGVAVVIAAPFGGDSVLEKAEAAVLAPLRAADGTIEHVLVEYRTGAGEPFIEYETWMAADGAWCRRTVEGVPGAAADTRLTLCRTSAGVVEVYLPARNEILRTRPDTGGAAAAKPRKRDVPAKKRRFYEIKPKPGPGGKGAAIVLRDGDGTVLETSPGEVVDLGPTPGWLNDDVIEDFRRRAVREAGTATLDGREYARLVTADGHDAVLVDRDTGEAVAWIPSAKAFGVPTTVIRTRRTLPEDQISLSLTELHPGAAVREVSAAERDRAISSQYPRG
jgi:hypothetical protein